MDVISGQDRDDSRTVAARQLSRRHHFVPEFLLTRWADKKGVLRVHMKNSWTGNPEIRRRSPKSVCFRMNLLMLDRHPKGRDVLESEYMRTIDDRGAQAVAKIIRHGAQSLGLEDRVDLARLVLSLDIRRPEIVEKLRQAQNDLRAALNEDPELCEALAKGGYNMSAAELYDDSFKLSIAGRAMLMMTQLIDNPSVGYALVNAWWDVLAVGDEDEFVIGDAPMVRTHGYEDPNAIWLLPLSPKSVWIAANSRARLEEIKRMTSQRLAKSVNAEMASQTEKYLITATARLDDFAAKRVMKLEVLGERRRKAREKRFDALKRLQKAA